MYAISKFRGIGEVTIPILQDETKILEQKITDQMIILRDELEYNIEILDRYEREGIPKLLQKTSDFYWDLVGPKGDPSFIVSIANKDSNFLLDLIKVPLWAPGIISTIAVKTFFLIYPPVNWKLTKEEINERIIEQRKLLLQLDLHETILIKFLAFKWMTNKIRINCSEDHIILGDDITAKIGKLLLKSYSDEII
ncbi:MAG: hypothetical protein H0V82_02465 [Candidatus Protochlamydia sp.]|nr:hypothetical protein [Candidatus Protochlamydia sp.]